MKAEPAVRVGVRRIRAGQQEGCHAGQGEGDGHMEREVLVVVVDRILHVVAGMPRVVEGDMLRVAGNLEQEEEVLEDSRRIGREEDHREEDSGPVVEVDSIPLRRSTRWRMTVSLLRVGRVASWRLCDFHVSISWNWSS